MQLTSRFLAFIFASIVSFSGIALADDRFTVCSITINSDDEIRMFQKYLPASQFRFVELTDHARMTPATADGSWFGNACESGVHCDMLVLSAHFGNTWAGDYGTTFAGRSGISLPLPELEQQRCEQTCSGILGNPLEVFLFGCKTLNDDSAAALSSNDLALLGRHDLPPASAARVLDEAENGGEDSSSLRRMQFVFGGVPRLYGFTQVAPAGVRMAPLLEKYLQGVGDYAAHLRELRQKAHSNPTNIKLERALEPTCFTQAGGLDPKGADYARSAEACFLSDDRNPVPQRRAHVDRLLGGPRFLGSLSAIGSFLRRHPPTAFEPAATGATAIVEPDQRGTRGVARELLAGLDSPILRLELLRISRSMSWVSPTEELAVKRQIVLRLLRPPVYGEGRNMICGMDPDALAQMNIRAEEVPPDIYRDEYGIQALGCLKPKDERIHQRLAQSLNDSREWISRLAATALRAMRPARL